MRTHLSSATRRGLCRRNLDKAYAYATHYDTEASASIPYADNQTTNNKQWLHTERIKHLPARGCSAATRATVTLLSTALTVYTKAE